MSRPELDGRWRAFLAEVDDQLSEDVVLHCLGGFVAALQYGLPRPTGDLDYLEITPSRAQPVLENLAGEGSSLAKKHGFYLQYVPMGRGSIPHDYEDRLTRLLAGRFKHLHLFALESHDLALSKLSRNIDVDREDVRYLARAVPLEPRVLRERYKAELRPYILGDKELHDRTLDMWIEAYFPPEVS